MTVKTFSSRYYDLEVPEGRLHIHIDFDEKEKKIKNIFLNLPPLGTSMSNLVSFIGISLSKYFQLGGDLDNILKHLNSVKGSKKVVIDENNQIESITQAIAYALKDFKQKNL